MTERVFIWVQFICYFNCSFIAHGGAFTACIDLYLAAIEKKLINKSCLKLWHLI